MNGIDQRNRLADDVFSYRAAKNGTVFIAWQGKTVTTLKGKAAERFLARIDGCDHRDAQLVMAKATGQFKHGNERMGRQRNKD